MPITALFPLISQRSRVYRHKRAGGSPVGARAVWDKGLGPKVISL